MRLQAFADKVVVHPIEDKGFSPSGLLIIPESAKQRTDQGIIVSVGERVKGNLSTGDHVVFSPYSGDKVSVDDGGIFFVVREDQIVAKLTTNKTRLVDTETMKRIVRERFSEMQVRLQGGGSCVGVLNGMESDILDRLDTLTQAEGFEF